MQASKLLRILYIVASLILLAMFLVATFSLGAMQKELNRKRTESARRSRWMREPEPEPEPDPELIDLQPEKEQDEAKVEEMA